MVKMNDRSIVEPRVIHVTGCETGSVVVVDVWLVWPTGD